MRYKVGYPFESGKNIAVFELKDDLYPAKKQVLTLIPDSLQVQGFSEQARQIEARSSLKHPALPTILDVAFRGGHPGLVTEYFEHPSLDSLIGTLTLEHSMRIALILSDLLHQMHLRKFYAGYLNPRKIFIDQENNPLLNFLMSRHKIHSNQISDYSMRYAAPEYLESGKPSAAGDLYSLGMILYFVFTGSPPFHETVPVELRQKKKLLLPSPIQTMNPLLNEKIALLIEALLHPEPKKRPTAKELIRALKLEIPDFKNTPVELTTGIIGRATEIREFSGILKDPAEDSRIVLIEGTPGVGKSKLADYFQLMARLEKFTVHTVCGVSLKPGNPESEIPKNKKLLLRILNPDRNVFSLIPKLVQKTASGSIILIETTEFLNQKNLTELSKSLASPSLKMFRFHLNLLNKHETRMLVNSLLGDSDGYLYFRETSGYIQGNPLFITGFIQENISSGGLLWDSGKWLWIPGKAIAGSVPEPMQDRLLQQLKTLTPHQLKVLKLLVIFERNIPFPWLTGILRKDENQVLQTARELKEMNLVEISERSHHPEILIAHKWISITVLDRIPPEEKEKIHGQIGLKLEEIYLREQQFSIVFDLCLHYIKSRNLEKAAEYLPEAITYLIRNSSLDRALLLFEEALSENLISVKLPANWLTYIKLLLKTGKEKRCRCFIQKSPPFRLNNVILFRLGYLLESLDLDACEICPHLSASIDMVFSRASSQGIMRTSQDKGTKITGKGGTFKIFPPGLSGRVLQKKTISYHRLFRMYQEQGHSERALSYEIKAFRLSLRLGKKGVAARRLLNAAGITISRDQTKRASIYLEHCLKMAAETGDMKTRLEAEIYLTVADRKQGQHLKAEFNLARIRSLNQIECGSRKISGLLLLEEAKNLACQSSYDAATKKIMELHRLLEDSRCSRILDEALLLEAWIWAARRSFKKALSRLEKLKTSSASRQNNFFARVWLLSARVHKELGNLESAELSINQLISRKIFLSPGCRVETRILQAELNLIKNNLRRAGTYINDGLRIAEKHCFIPLLVEACLVKAQWLVMKEDFQLALQFSGRAARLATKTDRQDLEFRAQLIREMAVNKSPEALPFPVHDAIGNNYLNPVHFNTKNTIGRRQSYYFKTRHFMAFASNRQNPSSIALQMHKVVKETFPEAETKIYINKKGILTRFIPDEKSGTPENTADNRENYAKLLRLDPIPGSIHNPVLFPIGQRNKPYGILSVDFPAKTVISEPDYEFLRLLSEISGSSSGGQEKIPLRCITGNSITLRNGKVIVGQAPCFQIVLNSLMRIADMETTVLIQGESGTGKELMAMALHDCSNRKAGPFIPVNCSTLPSELVENELFGHIRGCFTGADSSSPGLFEAAVGGTIFLDEISTLPLALQPRLLRVLENKTVRPLGSSVEKHLDLRVVAATNQDLGALARSGKFRFDLLQRLNAFNITVPPLRKRKSDIQKICLDYIEKHPLKKDKDLSDQAIEELCKYDFPGNVRELLNIMENLLCFSPSRVISAGDVREIIPSRNMQQAEQKINSLTLEMLDRISREKLNFWEGVRDPFIRRDLNREEVRQIISEGLKNCNGSYKGLLEFFNLPAGEYKKFLSFLEHHDCKVDFRKFRNSGKHRN